MHPEAGWLDSKNITGPDADLLRRCIPQQYEVMGKVSQGGMGAIYKVKNRYTGTPYALKVVRQNSGLETASPERFTLEAKAASSLNHPNICRVCDFGMTGDTPYLVMEWIDGISLQRKVDRDGPVPLNEALSLFQQIAQALEHAHAHKVVHRDLKPDNVMLTRASDSGQTQVHIVDFGLAKVLSDAEGYAANEGLTRSGMIMGSPLYMSPEQARGFEVDPRTDVYSLGCLMYMALTGTPPFRGISVVDTITKHLHEQPPPIDANLKIPADLQNIVLKAIEKQPEHRYQSMTQLMSDLAKVASGGKIAPITLHADRRKFKNRIANAFIFVAAFAAVYSLSLALQDFLDSHAKSSPHKSPGEAHTRARQSR